MSTEQTPKPWHAEFPAPKTEAAIMPRNRVMQMLSMRGVASLLVIDLRRMDFEGGCLRGSLNIPAQGFWWNRGMLYV
jgi:arsenical-resistance protein 2